MSDEKCPYCGHEIEICHDDGYGYEEGVKHQIPLGGIEKVGNIPIHDVVEIINVSSPNSWYVGCVGNIYNVVKGKVWNGNYIVIGGNKTIKLIDAKRV